MRRHALRNSRQRGYTLVELMMALAIFMISMLGIVSMQRVAAASSAHAKNLAIAQQVGRAVASQLELEATRWNTAIPSNWLDATATWRRLPYVIDRKFGSGFDGLGNPLSDSAADKAQVRFCSNVRVSWLFPTTMGRAGNGVLRAEIRVFWLRDGVKTLNGSQFCSEDDGVLSLMAQNPEIYQFVYQTVALRQHSQL
jgi:prepilin-type N-terminal cleavage/methylation domain-containing protein